MFDPMFTDPLLQLVPWAIALGGFVVGMLWIRRIIRDIEDN